MVFFSALIRFTDLGYSDYSPDETTVMSFFRSTDKPAYLLDQRKGPMQIVVAATALRVSGDIFDEFSLRFPFAVASLVAVVVVYAFVSSLTNNVFSGLVAATFFSFNGFFVAFGRIVQYQSLNILFSFLSLLFFLNLSKSTGKKIYINGVLGVIALSFSLLSHWDFIFVLVPITYFVYSFLIRQDVSRATKKRTLFTLVVIGSLLTLPFLIPFLSNLSTHSDNQAYFSTRVGINKNSPLENLLFTYNLYNPFYSLGLLLATALLGLCFGNHKKMFILWLIFDLLYFFVFSTKPGTHLYNILFPVIILSGVFFGELYRLVPRYAKIIPVLYFIFFSVLFYVQSYTLLVNHSEEYPWSRKVIFGNETIKYTHENLTNNIIGFPLGRNWKEINEYVNSQNELNGENLGFITNENSSMADFYMDALQKPNDDVYYAIGVKKPLSFVNDYKFSQVKNKYTVHKFENEFDNTIVNIYIVGRKPDESK